MRRSSDAVVQLPQENPNTSAGVMISVSMWAVASACVEINSVAMRALAAAHRPPGRFGLVARVPARGFTGATVASARDDGGRDDSSRRAPGGRQAL